MEDRREEIPPIQLVIEDDRVPENELWLCWQDNKTGKEYLLRKIKTGGTLEDKTIILEGNLYNMIFGVNPFALELLRILDLKPEDVGRFRDVYLRSANSVIIIYTRNGGDNRVEYAEVMKNLARHPYYLTDWDDDFDNTYAYIAFKVPEDKQDEAKLLTDGSPLKTVGEKFQQLTQDMENKVDSELTRRAFEVGKKIFGQMGLEFEGGKDVPRT